MKLTLKAPGSTRKRLKLEHEKLLSNFAFNLSLRRYVKGHPNAYSLDDHHRPEKNKPFLVCGRAWHFHYHASSPKALTWRALTTPLRRYQRTDLVCI
jgi:hypothetical protein